MSGARNRKKQRASAPDATAEILRHIQSSRIISRQEILHIFHVDKRTCHGCRSNTKDRPQCLCGLIPPANSSRKQGLWQKASDLMHALGPDPTKDARGDVPSGLTNLGATCYVNSVLQCLYMNTAFRNGFFSAEPELITDNPVLLQLARLFAFLHSGPRSSVDSAAFAVTLELDNAIQQDGQEFLKLLLSLLERILSQSKVPEARSIVQNVFRGTFSHVTKCSVCARESDASKQFVDFYELELNVKGFSSLEESLADYLSEDKLQGENQYFCQHCNARVDATHSTKLRQLPPVLNFQLKRFVFNLKTATKKKVSSKFSFPKVLDMSGRVSPIGSSNDLFVYDLSAILIHKGGTASSGHYIAHIKDEKTGLWWQFDDENVCSLGHDPLGNTGTSSPGASENSLQSADAYMLMYSRRAGSLGANEATLCLNERDNELILPAQVKSEVEQLVREFISCCEAFTLKKEKHLQLVSERKEEVRSILAKAPITTTPAQLYWISIEWLRSWSDSLQPPSAIDNTPLLCHHNAVSHKNVSLMKCVSEVAWKELHSKYGGGPELTVDSCCKDCIFEDAEAAASADNFRSERSIMKSLAEQALAGRGLEGELFYVSRSWLAQWIRRKSDVLADSDADPTGPITCPHDELLPEQAPGARRQQVTAILWSYFYQNADRVTSAGPRHKPFPASSESCKLCETELTEAVFEQEGLRATKMEMRQKQDAVYSGKNVVIDPNSTYYLVPYIWIVQWRAYLGASGKKVLDEPGNLEDCITSLLCEKHNRLLHKPPQLSRSKRGEITQKVLPDDVFTVVCEEDWLYFCQQWDVEPAKGIKAVIDAEETSPLPSPCKDGGGKNGMNTHQPEVTELRLPSLRTIPEICKQCIDDRESTELIRKLSYTDETVFVELVQGEPPHSLLDFPQTADPERRTSKRTRRTAASGNKKVSLIVSGTTTVYSLKLLIWECLEVVKENQKLHFGRQELTDDNATLADAGILPGSQLWVTDTGLHENRDIAEELPSQQANQVEEGFRGTRLMDMGFGPSDNVNMDVDVCKGSSSPPAAENVWKAEVERQCPPVT